jgi:hypothetical protein
MSKADPPICGTCGYWQEGMPGLAPGLGLCRRNPPNLAIQTPQGLMLAQPYTNGVHDWCGEWEVFPQRPFVMPQPTPAEILLQGVADGLDRGMGSPGLVQP